MGLVLALTLWLPWIIHRAGEDPWWGPKEAIWVLGCWSLVLWACLQRPILLQRWRNQPAVWLGLYALVTGVVYFYWPYLDRRAGHPFDYNVHIWFATGYVLMSLLTVWVLAGSYLTTDRAVFQLTKATCYASLLVAVYMLYQAAGLDQFYRGAKPGNTGFDIFAGFGNISVAATYLSVTTPLFLLFKQRRYLLYVSIVLWALYLTHVRYAIGIGIGGLVIYGLLRVWWKIARWERIGIGGILLMGSLISLPFFAQALSHDERWLTWKETIVRWEQPVNQVFPSILIGQGVQRFYEHFHYDRERHPIPNQQRWLWAHNEYLQALYEWGLIGLGLIVATIISALRRGWRQTHDVIGAGWFASAISLLLVSSVMSPFHLAPTAWTALCIWAMVERSSQGVV